MTNAEAWFISALRPRKPESLLGRTAQDGHLDSHTAPELWTYHLANNNYIYTQHTHPNTHTCTTHTHTPKHTHMRYTHTHTHPWMHQSVSTCPLRYALQLVNDQHSQHQISPSPFPKISLNKYNLISSRINSDLQQVLKGEHPLGVNHTSSVPVDKNTQSYPTGSNWTKAFFVVVVAYIHQKQTNDERERERERETEREKETEREIVSSK